MITLDEDGDDGRSARVNESLDKLEAELGIPNTGDGEEVFDQLGPTMAIRVPPAPDKITELVKRGYRSAYASGWRDCVVRFTRGLNYVGMRVESNTAAQERALLAWIKLEEAPPEDEPTEPDPRQMIIDGDKPDPDLEEEPPDSGIRPRPETLRAIDHDDDPEDEPGTPTEFGCDT